MLACRQICEYGATKHSSIQLVLCLMKTQTGNDDGKVVLLQPSLHWRACAVEAQSMADEAENLHGKAILENIAKLYDALATRPN
jgi:hypothetical protein